MSKLGYPGSYTTSWGITFHHAVYYLTIILGAF